MTACCQPALRCSGDAFRITGSAAAQTVELDRLPRERWTAQEAGPPAAHHDRAALVGRDSIAGADGDEHGGGGCGIEATAADEGEVQNRSYPNSVGRHQGTEGWEFVERYDLAGNAGRC